MIANRFLGQILALLGGLPAAFSGKRKTERRAAHHMAFAGGPDCEIDHAHAPRVAPPPERPVKSTATAASVEKAAARIATPVPQDSLVLPAALPLPLPQAQAPTPVRHDAAPVRPGSGPGPAPVVAQIPVPAPVAAPAAAKVAPAAAPAMRSLEEVRADLARLRANAKERHAQLKAQHESAFAPTDFLDFSAPAPVASEISETAYASTAFFDFKVLEPTPGR